MAADPAEEGTRRYIFMFRFWLKGVRKYLAFTCVALVATAGVSRAEDKDGDLRRQLDEQAKQIQELKQMIQNGGIRPAAADTPKIDDAAVKKIVESYLKDNPGAGMPPSVQTGYAFAAASRPITISTRPKTPSTT